MEETNVNNLNGVPNFGHGLPPDGVVVAGVTDVPQTEVIEEAPADESVEKVEETPVEEVVPIEETAPTTE